MSSGIIEGNAFGIYNIQVNITPAAVAATTAPAYQTFTVPGLKATDSVIDVTPPSDVAGVAVVNSAVTAANTLGLKFVNPTAGSLTPGAGAYFLTVLRPGSGVPATAIGD